MQYKRVSRDYWDYALYPKDVEIDSLIQHFGPQNEYYYSIYLYNQDHYDKYLNGLKEVCDQYDIKFNTNELIQIVSSVRKKINLDLKKNKITQAESEILKRKFSVAGTLDVRTNKLVFDFDSEKDIEKARKDTIELYSRLITNGFSKDNIQLCFSGNKGFSIEIETDSYFTRREFENTINYLTKDLETFDPTVKDEQRLFRIPLTRNKNSGLYKIPLTIEELHDVPIDVIKEDAKPQLVKTNEEYYKEIRQSWIPTHLPESIKNLKNVTIEEKKQLDENKTSNDSLDLSRKPNWLSPAKFALQEGFFEKGTRNNALMILASTYKANGFPERVAYGMLKGVADLQAQRTGEEIFPKEEIWNNIIQIVYGPNWKGGTYSEKQTKLLQDISKKFNLGDDKDTRELFSVESAISRFKEFASEYSKNRIKIGLESLDNKITITAGMAVGLLGSPGSGKTSLALNFMKHMSLNNERVLFECLDMTDNFIIARLLQSYTKYDFQEILHKLENKIDDPVLDQAFVLVMEEYKNVSINFRSGSTVEDIENDIKNHYKIYNCYPKLVVIDYLEKVRGPYEDPTANVGFMAGRLTDLARTYNVCVLMLLQPQKIAGDAREPLLSMRKVKGSSIIEQDCRVIITMWRPGYNPENNEHDNYTSIAIVKNNMGESCKLDFAWDGVSGNIREMNYEERHEYQLFQEYLAQQEKERQEKSLSW